MVSLSRDDRDKHLITRGNVDGIVSAAVFLNRFPDSRVTFVTSPTAGARALSMDTASAEIFLVDLAAVDNMVDVVARKGKEQTVTLIDHHPSTMTIDCQCLIREDGSAANALYHYLESPRHLRNIVAVADLIEYKDTPLLRNALNDHGRQKLFDESKVLDFSWRLIIDDDRFRFGASRQLSSGPWPSEVDSIKHRYIQVVNEKRWPRALAKVDASIKVLGRIGVLDDMNKNRTLYGFGTRALVEVAKRRNCDYAVMINPRGRHASVSVRGIGMHGIDLGRFVEEFTSEHGLEGGGHPNSAGARIPSETTEVFLDSLSSRIW